jgi:hypothetical protein
MTAFLQVCLECSPVRSLAGEHFSLAGPNLVASSPSRPLFISGETLANWDRHTVGIVSTGSNSQSYTIRRAFARFDAQEEHAVTYPFGLVDPRSATRILREVIVTVRGKHARPISTLHVTILGRSTFRDHVLRSLARPHRDTAKKNANEVRAQTHLTFSSITEEGFGDEASSGRELFPDIVICDWSWWAAHPGAQLIRLRSRDGFPPALIVSLREKHSADDLDFIERFLGAYMIGALYAPTVPASKALRHCLYRGLGQRAGALISQKIGESLLAQGALDPHDSLIGAIQIAIRHPEVFNREADFSAAAASVAIDKNSTKRDGKKLARLRAQRKQMVQRRLKALGLEPPARLLGLARLLHALSRAIVYAALAPSRRINLGILALSVGISGDRRLSKSPDSARRVLNELAESHFSGLSFIELSSRIYPHELTAAMGPLIAQEHWFSEWPTGLVMNEYPEFANDAERRAWVINQYRK